MNWSDEAELLLVAWRSLNPNGFSGAVDSAQRRIDIRAADDSVLDFTDCPIDLTVHVDPAHAYDTKIHVRNVDKQLRVVFDYTDATTPGSHLHVQASTLGTVVVLAGTKGVVTFRADRDCRGTFELTGQLVVPKDGLPSGTAVTIKDAHVEIGGNYTTETLRCVGSVTFHVNKPSAFRNLMFAQDSTLGLYGSAVQAETVEGDPPTRGGQALLSVSAEERDNSSLACTTLRDLHLVGVQNYPMLKANRVENVTATGRLSLTVAELGNGIHGVSVDAAVPTLAVQQKALALNLSGSFEIGDVVGANLEGGKSGFEIVRIRTTSQGRSAQQRVGHAVLRGFRLPGGLSGRMLLAQMGETFYVDPSTTGLPGSDLTLRISDGADWRTWLLGSARRPRSDVRMHHDAEFMRELHRLVIEKGAPGATRSKVGWCSYRLRHATTRGVIERLALTGYRCIGYGERPAPALLTWLVLALAGAATVLGWEPDLSPDGVRRLASETLEQGFGPLAAVMRTGTATLSHQYEYVFRAIVAIPLLTAALSLRNYVKSGATN